MRETMANSTVIMSGVTYSTTPGSVDCIDYFNYYDVRKVFEFWIQPFIYLFGIPGNSLALLVWLLPHMRQSPAGYYFASLAISDECTLVVHLIFNIQTSYGQHGLLASNGVCKFLNIVFLTSQNCSIFIGLAMTIERFIGIRFPFHRSRLFETRKVLKVLLMIIVTSLFFGVVRSLIWNYGFDIDTHSCIVQGRARHSRGQVMNAVNIVFIVIGVVLPIGTIFVLNIFIIVNLVKIEKKRKTLLQSLTRSEMRRQEKESSRTIQILCIGLYMVIAKAPDNITYLLQPSYPPGSSQLDCPERTTDSTWVRYYNYLTAAVVIETFALTSYAFNILIYSVSGKRFRRSFRIATLKVLSKCKIVEEPTEPWSTAEVSQAQRPTTSERAQPLLAAKKPGEEAPDSSTASFRLSDVSSTTNSASESAKPRQVISLSPKLKSTGEIETEV